MRRNIILSINEDPQYLFYVPLALWAWRKIGWNPILFFHNGGAILTKPLFELALTGEKVQRLLPIKGYRSDTMAQISRLYGSLCVEFGEMVMTGDLDLIPLGDWWNPNPSKITIYNHDLTGYSDYAICYLAATRERWIEIMGISGDYNSMIERDLKSIPNAHESTEWEKRWSVDQAFITQKIKDVQFEKEFIPAGRLPSGLAIGRVDRGGWTLEQPYFKDAHLHRDLYKVFQNPSDERYPLFQKKWREHMELLYRVWPEQNWTWFEDYSKQFAELI